MKLGESLTRAEDDALLRGQGRYAGDLSPDGALWMAVVRSPHAAGRIRALDAAEARAMPGVRLVLTGSDQAGAGLSPFPLRFVPPGTQPEPTPFLPLAVEAVRWAGEPVAAVIAKSRAEAEAAAEAVLLEVDDAPAVVDARAAAETGAPHVWEGRAGNVVFDYRAGDHEAVATALAGAAHVVRERVEISRVAAMTLEPRTCLAVPDGGGRLTLHTGTQSTHRIRGELATVMGMAPESLRVVAQHTGGSFGMRNGGFPEDALALWAARETGAPVRWRATRADSFLSDTQSRVLSADCALALDADGRVTGLHVEGVAPVGAQLGPMAAHHMTANMAGLAGVYRVPAIAVAMRGVHVNTVHMAPYRGAGRPEAIYVIERMMDIAAARLGIDRVDLRRRNMIRPEDMPHATPLGFVYDSGDFPRALDAVLQAADHAGFPARRAEAAGRGRLRGLGLACAIEPAGGGPGGVQAPEFGALRVTPGAALVLEAGSGDAGQGHATTFRQIAADLLGWQGVVQLVTGDTAAIPRGTGTFGSRTMGAVGAALADSARQVIEAAAPDAAEHLEAAPGDIAFERGAFRIVGTDRAVTLEALAAATGRTYEGEAWVSTEASTFPNGAHAAEVEIDPETGALEVVAYHVADDIGTVINPLLAEGQIHGGVAQGLGQALMERMVYDEGGALLSGSLMDYAVPRASDLAPISVHHCPTPTRANPLGAKGVGESGCVGALAVGISAVCDALSVRGVDHVDMPASPYRIWEALRAAEKERGAER